MSAVGKVRRTRMRAIESTSSTPSRDRGHGRHLVAVLQRRLLGLEEPDVLLVDVDIDEAPQLPRLVEQTVLQPRELSLEVVDEAVDRFALGLDLGIALRERAQRRGNPYEDRHFAFSSYDVWDLRSASARSKAVSEGLIFTWASSRSWRASGVFRPLPVMDSTIDSSRGMTPRSMSFLAAATVTPPAVSVKMPSVRARSSIPSMISSSVASSPAPS